MDSMSKRQGVPLFTTQAEVYPKVSLSSSSGSSSFPIRAPLTIDSDTSSNYSSDNGLESEGFLSGEDEFGTASERPFVAHPDDETPEETSADEEFVVSRPFVTDPDEEIIEETSNVEKFVVSRPFVSNPDRMVIENRVFSRPVVVNVNEETLVTPPEEEEDEYDLGVEKKVMDVKVLPLPKPGMPPICQLSGDSDEDSVGSVVEEDDGFSGVVRIPSTGILEKLSAPKVQVLGVDDGDEDEDESQFEAVLESEVVEDSISGEVLNGVVGFDEEQVIVEKDSVKDSISAGLVKDESPDVKDVAKSNASVESEVPILLDSSVLDENSEYAVEEIQVLTNMEQVTELYETNSLNPGCDAALEYSSKTQGEMTVDSIHDKEVIEGGRVLSTGTDEVKSVIYFAVDSPPLGADKDVDSKNETDLVDVVIGLEANAVRIVDEKSVLDIRGEEIVKPSEDVALKFDVKNCANEETAEVDKIVNLDAVFVNDENCEYNDVEVNESTILNPGSGSEKLETPIEQETDFCNGHSPRSTEGGLMEDELHRNSNILEPASLGSDSDHYLEVQNNYEADCDLVRLKEGEESSHSDDTVEGLNFGELDTVKDVSELEKTFSSAFFSGGESSRDHSQTIDGQIVTVSDEEVDTGGESECETIFDSAEFAALLNAAKGAGPDGGSVSFTSADGSRIFSLDCHAGLSSTNSSMELTPQSNHPNLSASTELDSEKGLSKEEEKKKFEIQQIRVKFLRLVQRLGLSAEVSIAAQVLYQLDLASGRPSSRGFRLESAKRTTIELEANKKNELDFSLNILIIGKSGVGKSATINSIFGEEKAMINPFEPATTSVKEIVGTIDGIKVRVLDTPGLRSSLKDQSVNKKILKSVKRFTKKYPPDVVIYADRLDIPTRDFNDLPLLRSITSSFGSSVWRNSIVALTHAASTPPDGPSGSPLSYEVFVAQRSRVVQQLISHAVGDLRMINAGLMCPVCLVENHQMCKKNVDGQFLLPNGETWRPQLLLLCYSMKILSEANSIVKAQVPLDHRKLFGLRVPLPPLPYLLSSLLQSCAHPKLSADQGGDNVDSDIELECSSDSDQEDEDEYDQLPRFKLLRKSEIAKLSKEQINAYFEQYDYRVKLLQKKQWREDIKKFREIKKKGKEGLNDFGYMEEEQETGSSAAAAIPLPDMILPRSFNGENPSYRYRFLEPTSHLVATPVLIMHGWDHDWGYDGVSLEQSLAVANRFPAVIVAQITKDKKELNIHIDSSVSAKHWENGSTMAGLDIQTIGAQLAYILKGETKLKNFKINKTAVGGSMTFLGENVVSGLKLEDHISIGKRLVLVGSSGVIQSQGDTAYGANLEMCLREKDYPVGQNQTTLSLSLMRWRGDLMWGCNMQSQFSIGRNSKLVVSAGLNKQRSGQISVRTSSSEQLQIALVGLLPIARTILRNLFPSLSERY